ncbi:MBL fold metallo-hydrolase [candidate division KSB1 bacterium]
MEISRRTFCAAGAASLFLPYCSVSKTKSNEIALPKIVALGIIQDGGLPQIGCDCERCTAARKDLSSPKYVSSLGIVTSAKKTYVIDATPDFKHQADILSRSAQRIGKNSRNPVDGVFLTHAHMGHYTGLMQLGFEAVSSDNIPVYCTQDMAHFIENNAPWDLLLRKNNIVLRPLMDGISINLDREIDVRPVWVPHRQEYTDTVGFIISGSTNRVLYIPDIDRWEDWEHKIEEVLQEVTIAILDGSFYSGDELPGRDMTQIPHPTISTTMERLKGKFDPAVTKVYFTHFNHTNPVLNRDSAVRDTIRENGFYVLEQNQEISL